MSRRKPARGLTHRNQTSAEERRPFPFFDARRCVYYARPALRGWLHVAWFGAVVVAGPLLPADAHGATRITAGAIYATSVSALFGVSALYHRGNWSHAGVAQIASSGNVLLQAGLTR